MDKKKFNNLREYFENQIFICINIYIICGYSACVVPEKYRKQQIANASTICGIINLIK